MQHKLQGNKCGNETDGSILTINVNSMGQMDSAYVIKKDVPILNQLEMMSG